MSIPQVVELTQKLISFPSVTPADKPVFDELIGLLSKEGFQCDIMTFQTPGHPEVHNLFARFGTKGPHFCFAGHLDVVGAGSQNSWSFPPFSGEESDGHIYGRGAVDMKGAVAAFVCAALRDIKRGAVNGSISLLLTGDEEEEGIDGTVKALKRLKEIDQVPDFCLVGEPTSETWVGDSLKVGRRGSLTLDVVVHGQQGHVAYPEKAHNPSTELIDFLHALNHYKWDKGDQHFDPSNLEITTIDIGNPTSNMVPDKAKATLNIRFSPVTNRQEIIETFQSIAKEHLGDFEFSFRTGSEPFISHAPALMQKIKKSVHKVTGKNPRSSTTGGTSDARHIHFYCPVIELGLLNDTAHKVDERVSVKDLKTLQAIYEDILASFFKE